MRKLIHRVVVAAALAAVSASASAHEFTCDEVAGVVQVDASGLPVIGWAALPVYASQASPVLTLHAYPAIVGFRVGIHDVAAEASVVTGVTDAFTAGLTAGRDYALYGLFSIGPGFSVPAGGSAYLEYGIRVASQEDCLSRFGAGSSGAPVCTDTAEDRFVVTNDVGSTECRARIVCGEPGIVSPPLVGPPPPPACPATWHGVKQWGTPDSDGANALALDSQCNVSVAGDMGGSNAQMAPILPDGFLATFSPAGDGPDLEWRDGTPSDPGAVAVDLAGNRYVGLGGGPDTGLVKFDPGGARLWTRHDIAASRIAVDVSGNVYASGGGAVTKLAPDGTTLWSYDMGSPLSGSGAVRVALDAGGNVLAGGYTDFFVGGGAGEKAVITKLDGDGRLLWTRLLTSGSGDALTGIAADASGNVYVGGVTRGAFPGNTALGGYRDAFVAKLDAAGQLQWIRQFGSPDDDFVWEIAADAAGDVWVIGSGFAPISGQVGGGPAWLAKFDSAGNALFAKGISFAPADIALDAEGDAFVCGSVTGEFSQPDAVVAKFDPLGNLQ